MKPLFHRARLKNELTIINYSNMRVLDCITCMETWCKEQRCWIYERKWIHLQAVQKITLFLHLARKIVNLTINKKSELSEADLGLLQTVNYYHKALHLGCCSSPRSASGYMIPNWLTLVNWFILPVRTMKWKTCNVKRSDMREILSLKAKNDHFD